MSCEDGSGDEQRPGRRYEDGDLAIGRENGLFAVLAGWRPMSVADAAMPQAGRR